MDTLSEIMFFKLFKAETATGTVTTPAIVITLDIIKHHCQHYFPTAIRLFIGDNSVPQKGFINTVKSTFRQYIKNMAQIRFRVDIAQQTGSDWSARLCITLSAVITDEECIVFTPGTES